MEAAGSVQAGRAVAAAAVTARTWQGAVAGHCAAIVPELAHIADDALVVSAWLAREQVPEKIGAVAAACGFHHEKARAALAMAERHRLIGRVGEAYPGQPIYFQALAKAGPLATAFAEASTAAEAELVRAAALRGQRVADWLRQNPGWHREKVLAGWFLWTRWDLIDALEHAEAAGFAQSTPGGADHHGLRLWRAAQPFQEGSKQ